MMRALALLLLLANLAYHLWSLQRPPPAGSAPPPEPLPPGAERLLLLSERPRAPAPVPSAPPGSADAPVPAAPREAATSPAEPTGAPEAASAGPGTGPAAPAAAPGPHCERIGPLDPDVAARVVAALRAAGGQADVVPEPAADGPASVQLYVPAPASFAEAREIVRTLGEAGLEAYVMGREEVSGAVSVGLFTDPERARDRRARVEALGYAVAEREVGAPAGRVRVSARLSAPAIGRTLAGLDPDPEAFPRESVPCGAEEGEPASEPADS
jgi:hypothetical protein